MFSQTGTSASGGGSAGATPATPPLLSQLASLEADGLPDGGGDGGRTEATNSGDDSGDDNIFEVDVVGGDGHSQEEEEAELARRAGSSAADADVSSIASAVDEHADRTAHWVATGGEAEPIAKRQRR
eukprot:SAG22_NODE_668_length_7998_cov_4.353462_8_plen_127_part_00